MEPTEYLRLIGNSQDFLDGYRYQYLILIIYILCLFKEKLDVRTKE